MEPSQQSLEKSYKCLLGLLGPENSHVKQLKDAWEAARSRGHPGGSSRWPERQVFDAKRKIGRLQTKCDDNLEEMRRHHDLIVQTKQKIAECQAKSLAITQEIKEAKEEHAFNARRLLAAEQDASSDARIAAEIMARLGISHDPHALPYEAKQMLNTIDAT